MRRVFGAIFAASMLVTYPAYANNPADYYNRGRLYLEMGNWAQAIEMLSKSIELDSSNADFVFWLGIAYFAQGDFRSEKEEFWHSSRLFRQAIEMGDTNPISFFMLGNSLLHRGLYLIANNREHEAMEHMNPAIAQYQVVIKSQPDASNAFLNLGLAYYAMKNFDFALPAIRRSIELEPKIDFFHDFLGNTYFAIGQFEEALKEWTLVKKLNKKYESSMPTILGFEDKPISDKIRSARQRR